MRYILMGLFAVVMTSCKKSGSEESVSLTGLVDSIAFRASLDSTAYTGTSMFYYKLEYDNAKRVKKIRTNYGWNGLNRQSAYYYNGNSNHPYLIVDSSVSGSGPVATRIYITYNSSMQRIKDSSVTYSYFSTTSVSSPTIKTYTYSPGLFVRLYLTDRDSFFTSNNEIVERRNRLGSFYSNAEVHDFYAVDNPFFTANLKEIGYNDGVDFGDFAYVFNPVKFDITQNKKLPKTMTGYDNSYFLYQQGEQPVLNWYYTADANGRPYRVLLSKYFYKNGALFAKNYYMFSIFYHN